MCLRTLLSIFILSYLNCLSACEIFERERQEIIPNQKMKECIDKLVEFVTDKDVAALQQLITEDFAVFLQHKDAYDIGSAFDHMSFRGYLDMMKCMLISRDGEFIVSKESIFWAYKYAGRHGNIEVINYLIEALPDEFLPTQDVIDFMVKEAANYHHVNIMRLLFQRPKGISFPSEKGVDLAFVHASLLGGYGNNIEAARLLLMQREGFPLPSRDVMLAAFQNKNGCLSGFKTHKEKDEFLALLRPYLSVLTT